MEKYFLRIKYALRHNIQYSICIIQFLLSKLNKKRKTSVHLFRRLITICCSFLFTSYSLPVRNDAQVHSPYSITCVVIDAGHGGHDSGCLGSKTKEKNVALSIALRLGKYI